MDSVNEEMRQLIYEYQQLEQTVNVAGDQINSIQANIMQSNSAIATIESLLGSKSESVDAMIPIGSGCFVHATVKDISKVAINIGSGAVVEKSAEDAIAFLKERNDRFGKMLDDMNKSLTTITQKMNEIEQKIRSENR